MQNTAQTDHAKAPCDVNRQVIWGVSPLWDDQETHCCVQNTSLNNHDAQKLQGTQAKIDAAIALSRALRAQSQSLRQAIAERRKKCPCGY